jgi:hypothetical protein
MIYLWVENAILFGSNASKRDEVRYFFARSLRQELMKYSSKTAHESTVVV